MDGIGTAGPKLGAVKDGRGGTGLIPASVRHAAMTAFVVLGAPIFITGLAVAGVSAPDAFRSPLVGGLLTEDATAIYEPPPPPAVSKDDDSVGRAPAGRERQAAAAAAERRRGEADSSSAGPSESPARTPSADPVGDSASPVGTTPTTEESVTGGGNAPADGGGAGPAADQELVPAPVQETIDEVGHGVQDIVDQTLGGVQDVPPPLDGGG
jgi:hypothetical protein